MSRRAGYVLAGGRSTRMGCDKALLPFGNGTLGQAVAEAVRQAAGSVVLVGGSDRGLGYDIIPDLYPGEGPLGGILTALRNTAADWNLVVACDMPAVTADFLSDLLAAGEACEGDALIPADPDRHLEPLCAIYHRRSLIELQLGFEAGIRKLATALERVRMVVWPISEVSHFKNVNTPEDWAAYDR